MSIGNGGVLLYSGTQIEVGDYYCKPANASITNLGVVVKKGDLPTAYSSGIVPNSVIFLTNTSATDQGHGWSHGYAMALKCATTTTGENGTCTWGPSTDVAGIYNWGVQYNVKPSDKDYSWKDNLEGYTETHVIGDNSNYPAFHYALTFGNTVAVPTSSSGWFLPSCGQIYYMTVNLCKMASTPTRSLYDTSTNRIRWYTGDTTGNWLTISKTNMNGYINTAALYGASVYTCDNTHGGTGQSAVEYYWGSSEYSLNLPAVWYWGYNETIEIGCYTYYPKSNSYKVRPVLAF